MLFMKIFISHSSKDATIAKTLSSFLETIDNSIDVFCSSQTGSIKMGRDFVNEITKELNGCDIFIPLLSTNYYKSRFCMLELGFAYSCLSDQSKDYEGNYVYPLAVLPVKKAEALMDTPLARLQVCSINDTEDMRAYIEAICENKNITCGSGLNKKIHGFIYDINKIIFDSIDISIAKILLCKAGNVSGEDQDYLEYSVNMDGSGYTVNFRAKPFENSTVYADFLSVVFQYVDKINLYDMVNIYDDTKINFQINNYTNSISKIDIEIKHSDNIRLLHRQTVNLGDGVNNIFIPLKELKSEALKQVSEICFVIKSSAYIEDEGMFQIRNFKVTHKE